MQWGASWHRGALTMLICPLTSHLEMVQGESWLEGGWGHGARRKARGHGSPHARLGRGALGQGFWPALLFWAWEMVRLWARHLPSDFLQCEMRLSEVSPRAKVKSEGHCSFVTWRCCLGLRDFFHRFSLACTENYPSQAPQSPAKPPWAGLGPPPLPTCRPRSGHQAGGSWAGAAPSPRMYLQYSVFRSLNILPSFFGPSFHPPSLPPSLLAPSLFPSLPPPCPSLAKF